jgi:GDP-4-dehydro-6-deoxy-D-mannose reductase
VGSDRAAHRDDVSSRQRSPSEGRIVKYLITGSEGFVGSYLITEIKRRDPAASIVGVDRVGDLSLDLLDLEAFAAVIERERPDYLIHLASLSSVGASWQSPVASFTNNTNIFLNVLEGVRRGSPTTRILSVGSSEEYGVVTPDELPLRETSPLRPASPYAVARVAQGHLGSVYVRGYGLDIVTTRSFNHVGAGQSDQFVISALGKQFAEIAKGKRDTLQVGTTSVVRDFLDVRDVVSAYCQLLARGERGEVYNVCSGRGVTIADVIAMLETISGVHPKVVTDPARVRPVENAYVIGANEKIRQALGWQPQFSLEDSLRSVYEYWYTST